MPRIQLLEKDLKKVLSRTTKRNGVFHVLAVNFLNHHFGESVLDDSVVTNLRTLLRDQFNAGVASVRKTTKRTK